MSTQTSGGGYIEELLHAIGVDQTTAQHVQDLVLRPVTVALIVATAWVSGRVGARLIRRGLGRYRNRIREAGDTAHAQRVDTVSRIVANFWRVAIWIIATITTLSVLGIDLTPLLAGATVIGATIGFGAQSLVRDFLSGLLMLLEDQFRIGDVVTVNDITGTVEEVTLRITRLRSADGLGWYVPNGQILRVGNASRHWSRTLVQVVVRGRNAPLQEVLSLLGATTDEVGRRDELAALLISPPRVLGVSAISAVGITIDVEARTATAGDEVARALRQALVERLAEEALLPPAEEG